ncbi:hypothetical protein H6G96_32610 [Nostoc sp. FACHB-892]|uniref:hypothetical protein n=1 Tax=Nostoc sp. FACHB-892 TaxID=2692843 RepID=UPI00168424FF|nr:hypothetical protein [Nostoc sp. FACHB-892]MBD2730935.1 hypothetical protein [Nostoc sp. FACHB-892]
MGILPTAIASDRGLFLQRNITASELVLDAIKFALGKSTTTTPTDTPSLESIKAEIDI